MSDEVTHPNIATATAPGVTIQIVNAPTQQPRGQPGVVVDVTPKREAIAPPDAL